MRFALSLLAVATVAAAPLAAQDMKMDHQEPPADVKPLQDMYLGWVITAAEQSPVAEYAFKPTPEVRSLGQIFGHVANANYTFCSSVRGEKDPNTTDFEKADKAAIVAGLKAAAAYCSGVYEWANSHPHDQITIFGSMKGSVTWGLAFNLAHNGEHYGNIVTYMRLKGHVPPSSQGGM